MNAGEGHIIEIALLVLAIPALVFFVRHHFVKTENLIEMLTNQVHTLITEIAVMKAKMDSKGARLATVEKRVERLQNRLGDTNPGFKAPRLDDDEDNNG